MQTYAQYRPTGFDRAGTFLPDRQDWLVVPVIRTRDSSILENTNFDAALDILGGEQDDLVEVFHFNHWACGWFDIILVAPQFAEKVQDIEDRLESYPILNESAYSEAQYKAIYEYWESMSMRERIRYCAEANVSIFAARSKKIPDSVYDDLNDEIY